jgi:hypothetical protein
MDMKLLFPERREALMSLVNRLSPIDTETSLKDPMTRQVWEQDKKILAEAGILVIPRRVGKFNSISSEADTVCMKREKK